MVLPLLAVLAVVLVLVVLLRPDGSARRPDAAEGSALAAVQQLDVRQPEPHTGYSREEFGGGWSDPDGNGCDTRNDVLHRDLTDVRVRSDDPCVVQRGVLEDPYGGGTIPFQRGQGTSSEVQIDHVVALSDAWQKGAREWTAEQRARFANDPLELVAVDGELNAAKGDSDAAAWLPPRGRCPYVARQVAVKLRYDLWVTAAERDAMVDVLSGCPDEPLPSR